MEIFLFWLILAVVTGIVASKKGRSGFGWFLLAVLISPLIAGLIVIALPKAGVAAAARDASGQPITTETHTRCPECREVVRRDARKCMHCGSALEPGSVESVKPRQITLR